MSRSNLPRERRIEDLEMAVRDLQAQVLANGRRGRFGYPVQLRLFQSGAATGETYPADNAHVFPGRFVDGDFDPLDESQEANFTERAAATRTQARVYDLFDDGIAEGEVFPAFQLDPLEGTGGGRWWGMPKESGRVKYQNIDGSAGTQPVGAIMDVVDYDPVTNAYRVQQPTAGRFSPRWLVGLTETTYEGFGYGRFLGDKGINVANYIYDGTAAYGDVWGPRPGSWLAWKNYEGFLALRDNNDGTIRAHQRFANELLVLLHAGISYAGTAAARVLRMTPDGPRLSGFTLPTVFDAFLNSGESIESPTIGVVRHYCGRWTLINAYCTPSDREFTDTEGSPGVLASMGATNGGWVESVGFETIDSTNSFIE